MFRSFPIIFPAFFKLHVWSHRTPPAKPKRRRRGDHQDPKKNHSYICLGKVKVDMGMFCKKKVNQLITNHRLWDNPNYSYIQYYTVWYYNDWEGDICILYIAKAYSWWVHKPTKITGAALTCSYISSDCRTQLECFLASKLDESGETAVLRIRETMSEDIAQVQRIVCNCIAIYSNIMHFCANTIS